MQKSPPNLDVADAAPTAPIPTGYDEQHLVTYLRLLDAAADGADWKEVARPCCILTSRASRIGRDGRGKPISPVPAG